jgi:hypothetical protein
MTATSNGFVYNKETKVVITDFQKGNHIFTTEKIFYGSKEEALEFGLIFKEQ